MKYLNLLLLLLFFGCETSHVINNAKPPEEIEKINHIALAADTATRTWIPWYILIVIILTIVTIKVWKSK